MSTSNTNTAEVLGANGNENPSQVEDLKEDQLDAWNGIVKFLHDSEEMEYLLSGSGGSGKSFLLGALISAFNGPGVYVTATTHKAKRVLKGQIQSRNLPPIGTIHSLCGLTLKNNHDTGERDLVWGRGTGENSLRIASGLEHPLIVVDEASMIGGALLKKIRAFADKKDADVIFVGDWCQLPPVKEGGRSKIFNEVEGISQLTGQHRQTAGSALHSLAQTCRQALEGIVRLPPIVASADGSIERIASPSEFNHAFLDCIAAKEDAIFLAWNNKRVQAMNYAAHDIVWGGKDVPPQPGECMVSNTDVTISVKDEDTCRYVNKVVVRNSDICTVTTVQEGVEEDIEGYYISGYSIDSDKPFDVFVPKNYNDINKVIKEKFALGMEANAARDAEKSQNGESFQWRVLVRAAKSAWRKKFRAEELFADLRYPYASTIHKAQGSQWDTVFFDQGSLAGNRNAYEKKQLTYVAVSRPKNKLVVI